ncbi:MAG: hypothetical protein P4L41_18580 [Flavipsychrobacter sp.]|nr:hypothetical protein [Flavipsychrobacter sp.]
MKNSFLFIAIVSVTLFIAIISCKKTTYPNYTPPGSTTVTPSLNQLFAPLRSTPQSIYVVAGRDTVVYGTNGTMLHFYANSFKDAMGNVIPNGIINLQLIEMYKAGDMIRNRATTMANGQILQSGGQITMTASMSDGAEVFANTYGIGFKQANASGASMALFYGAAGSTDSTITWTQSDSTQKGNRVTGTVKDTASQGHTSSPSYYYFDTCKSLSWANCDWFNSNDSSKTTVSVILPDTSFNATNTQLYLVLPNVTRWSNTTNPFIAVLSSISDHYGSDSYNAATNTMKLISEGQTNIVPAGLNYDLVVIANKGGTFYYYEQSGIIPHNGLVAPVNPVAYTQTVIASKLQGL